MIQVDKTDEVAAPSINVQYMHLDLSSLKSVIDFVKKYKESGLPLHVLICNAGVFVADKGKSLTLSFSESVVIKWLK